MQNQNFGQKGNILFIILIGVALFTALTYTISRSSSSVSPSSEGAEYAKAQEILGFAEQISSAITRLQMQNDCRTYELSLKNSVVDGYTNPNAPDDGRCSVFDNRGGAAAFQKPPVELLDETKSSNSMYGDYLFTGAVCLDNVGTGGFASCSGDSTENEELLLILPWIKQSTCETINRILKNPETVEDTGSSFEDTKFKGSFSEGSSIGSAGHILFRNGCFKSNTTPGNGYHFYYTLMAK